MVDNIKFNKVLPSLSSAPKVNRTDRRKGKNQRYPFEEEFERKHRKKKKKSNSQLDSIPDGGNSAEDENNKRYTAKRDADGDEKSTDPSSSRIIDIRV